MLQRVAGSVAKWMGYELRKRERAKLPPDFESDFSRHFERCRPFTRTSAERMYALYQATKYVCHARIPGAIVECGVWRGGSSMLAALVLGACGDVTRDIWLYDTYEGMPPPTEHDRDWRGISAAEQMAQSADDKEMSVWCYSSLAEVRANMASTEYPTDKVRFIEGKVEDTLPGEAPAQIALLRLDTDFYESTYHELRHLFPRVSAGGVLIIDDYGHWEGARKATDEYLGALRRPILLHRIDYTGRIAVVDSGPKS